ncbi:SWIM zinc finger family protein, partial [Streptomyces sp. MCAF7]
DPEAARRRAERRTRRIAAGATELEQRLADLLREGLAGADHAGYATWDETAARMVDAQAPGLEARVRELGAIPSSGPGWPARLLEECALLHLLNQGFLRLDRLPEALATTTRSRVGLTTTTAELLASDTAVRD